MKLTFKYYKMKVLIAIFFTGMTWVIYHYHFKHLHNGDDDDKILRSNESLQGNEHKNLKQAEEINTLAVFHLEGLESFKVDEDKAVQLFYQAAQMGYAPAQYNLANCYIFGRGVSQDLEKAEPWLIKASELGFVDALSCLEWLYLKLEEESKSGD